MYEDPVDLIDDLSNAEILQLCGHSPPSKKVLDIIKREEENGGLDILRDEAYAKYWQRILELSPILDEEAITTLLSLPDSATAKSVLGDAAILNKLPPQHVETVLAHTSHCEWTHKQVLARHILSCFSKRNTNATSELICFEKMISSLIDLKVTWAILDILSSLTYDELLVVLTRTQNPTILNKGNRHRIKEAIQKEFKIKRN